MAPNVNEMERKSTVESGQVLIGGDSPPKNSPG
jgi:hypothetical protein